MIELTKKLYYSSPRTHEWETSITSVKENDGHFYITLAETAFYPEGGGQPSDHGTINGLDVLELSLVNDEVVHKLDSAPSTEVVSCTIDWSRRFDHMQQHSGQHLLSAVCRELFDAHTLSFHLGQDYVTIDIALTDLTDSQVLAIENKANQYIYENRKLTTYFVTNQQLQELPVVKPPKVWENIRIVEMEGIEFNPCGGTHVERTGEIGLLKIIKTEKQKSQTRIYFLSGLRTLADYTESSKILNHLTAHFNTHRSELVNRVEKLDHDVKNQAKEIEQLKREAAIHEAATLLSSTENGLLSKVFDNKSMKELQVLAHSILAEEPVLVLFATTVENKVYLSHNGTNPLDCGQFFKEQLPLFNGRGGGSSKAAQAGFTNEQVLKFFEFAKQQLQ